MNTELDKAAEKYAVLKEYIRLSLFNEEDIDDIMNAISDYAEQLQLEQKQVATDKAIEKLAEKEYPLENCVTTEMHQGYIDLQTGFIKGFKSGLQYSVGDGENIAIEFAKWKDDNGWKLDYQEQSTHSYEEHFYHFIHNVYKTPINK